MRVFGILESFFVNTTNNYFTGKIDQYQCSLFQIFETTEIFVSTWETSYFFDNVGFYSFYVNAGGGREVKINL